MILPRNSRRIVLGTMFVASFILFVVSSGPQAGTTGKIAGFVIDFQGRPVNGATVSLVGTVLETDTDVTGRFNIIGIPPGECALRATCPGHMTMVLSRIAVSSDQTTWVQIEIPSADEILDVIEIISEQPVVEVNVTSSVAILTSAEIENMPVQELQDIVNLQAGVVDGHFRGGRLGEVQFQVDGVSVNNPYDNSVSLRLDRSLLEEVQVISGTFDAEYGQAMSGVVNAVLKRGTDSFQWSAEVFSGGYFFPGGEERRLTDDTIHPAAIQNYQVTLSGPTGLPNTVYLLNGRRYIADDYIYAQRLFVPADSSDFENKIYYPTGDGEKMPLSYSREWSGAVKISNESIPGVHLNYQAVCNNVEGRHSDYYYRYNPDGLSTQKTISIVHGFDLAHALNNAAFYNLTFRHNYFDYEDFVFEDVYDPSYDESGPPIADDNYEQGAYLQGVDFTRFKQQTSTFLVKGSYLNQVTREHLVKLGAEYHLPRIRFGEPGHLVYTTVDGVETLVRHIDEPPDYPGVKEYRPVVAAGFAQDQLEWNDVTLRAGLRFDYFDARSTVPSDPANPTNSIAGAPESVPKPASRKSSLAPRLGVAYPISDKAAVHFAYGHFYQFPPIGTIFSNADYSVLNDLQAGGIDYGVMGNPDIKPEMTVQYEFGYKHAITTDLGLDVTLFYKDIRDLLGVEFVSTYNAAEYARLTNVDFGSVVGFTLALDRRRVGILSAALDYTWQMAQGNSSDPRETATRAEAGEDPRPRQVPFDWDQRHTFNVSVSLERPESYTAGAILRVVSGQPYTPVIESGFGYGLEDNSGRKPASMQIDLRAEKRLVARSVHDISLFARVFNLLDTRYFNGSVFPSTGSPYYSRFFTADHVALADPTRFQRARRIELGFKIGLGG